MRARYGRLIGHMVRVQLMNDVQYRANFSIQLFESVLSAAAAVAGMLLVLRHVPELNGWNQAQLLTLLGVYITVGGLLRMLVRPNLFLLVSDIIWGALDYVLTKPVDAQLLVSIRRMDLWQGTSVLTGGVITGWGVADSGTGVEVVAVIAFLIAVALGVFILYCLLFSLVTTAFWLHEVDEIFGLYESLYQTGRWPLTIYPEWLRIVLTLVIPVGFAVVLPAEILSMRVPWYALLGELAVAIIAFTGTRWFFRAALRRYSGASA